MKLFLKITVIIFTVFSLNSCVTNDKNIDSGIITVYGTGEITFIPNIMNLRIIIKNIDENLINATNKTRATLTEFISICNSNYIVNENIRTSNIGTGKEYKYDSQTRENEFVGFYSTMTILVSIDDFSKFEIFSGQILQFDDLSISNFRFSHTNIEEYEYNANLLALDNARLAAEKMANHMGLRLGKVTDISYLMERDPFNGTWYYDIEGTGRSTGGIPVSPGIMTLSKRIQIKFRIY